MPTIQNKGTKSEGQGTLNTSFSVLKGDLVVFMMTAAGGGVLTTKTLTGVSYEIVNDTTDVAVFAITEDGTATCAVLAGGYGETYGILRIIPDDGYEYTVDSQNGFYSNTTTGSTAMTYTYSTVIPALVGRTDSILYLCTIRMTSGPSSGASISGCVKFLDGYYTDSGYELTTNPNETVVMGRGGETCVHRIRPYVQFAKLQAGGSPIWWE